MDTVQAGSTLATGVGLTDLRELTTYLAGEDAWTAHEHNIAAHALNEYTSDQGMDHPVRYSNEL
jgi:hypothetical protein